MTLSILLLLRLKDVMSHRHTCHPPSLWIAQSEVSGCLQQRWLRECGAFFDKFAAVSVSKVFLSGRPRCHRLEPCEAKAHFQRSKSEQERATKKRQFF